MSISKVWNIFQKWDWWCRVSAFELAVSWWFPPAMIWKVGFAPSHSSLDAVKRQSCHPGSIELPHATTSRCPTPPKRVPCWDTTYLRSMETFRRCFLGHLSPRDLSVALLWRLGWSVEWIWQGCDEHKIIWNQKCLELSLPKRFVKKLGLCQTLGWRSVLYILRLHPALGWI